MKKALSILCAAALIIVMVSLAACGGGGQDISGTYRLVEMNAGGQDMTSMLSLVTVTMTVSGDTAVMDMMGDTLEFQVNTANQTFSDGKGSSLPYKVEGNQLILEGDDGNTYGKMVFEKLESTADSE